MRWIFPGFYTFFHLQLITGFSPTRFSIFCIQKLQQKYGIHKQIGYRNSRKYYLITCIIQSYMVIIKTTKLKK